MIRITIKGTYFEFTKQEAIVVADTLRTGIEREILGDPAIGVSIVARVEYSGGHKAGGELCPTCANFSMQRTGSCMTCQLCGTNTGCS